MSGPKIALVTGGASGIGLACAERLAADGMKVVLADLNEATGAGHAKRLEGDFVRADLSHRQGCKDLADEVLRRHGTVHVLVNNAGFQHVSPIEDFPEEQWERMIYLMLTAPFLLTRYVWPSMKKQKWGRVVNMGSIHALIASPFKVGYIAAKHGLVGLTRTAALEGGEFGITVNAVCPAYVRTPLVDNQIAAQAKANNLSEEDVIQKIMLAPAAVKRLIEPAEVAGLVSDLCSDAAATITGSAMTMDLGWTAR
jgi:3-hydroxybutyrate dehydrogenase